jgi:hypothetical protein
LCPDKFDILLLQFGQHNFLSFILIKVYVITEKIRKKTISRGLLWSISIATKRLVIYKMEDKRVIIKKFFSASFLEKLLRINIDAKIKRKTNAMEK